MGVWESTDFQKQLKKEKPTFTCASSEQERQQISLAFSSLLWLDPNKEISQGFVMSVEEKFLPVCWSVWIKENRLALSHRVEFIEEALVPYAYSLGDRPLSLANLVKKYDPCLVEPCYLGYQRNENAERPSDKCTVWFKTRLLMRRKYIQHAFIRQRGYINSSSGMFPLILVIFGWSMSKV